MKPWLWKQGKAAVGWQLGVTLQCSLLGLQQSSLTHKLLEMRSYTCTFLLTKPVPQQFRNAGLDSSSWVINYDLLLLQAVLQETFSLNAQDAPLKAIRFSATFILITIPTIKYIFLVSSLYVFTLCPFAIVPNWPFCLKSTFPSLLFLPQTQTSVISSLHFHFTRLNMASCSSTLS